MHVLIVDDDDIARELASQTLANAGYEVGVASNGREALEALRSGRYNLVVSDWEMPEMNGIELCRKIRERHFSSYIYVILVTCRDGTDNVVEGLSAGADDFITKPFDPAELCVRLRCGVRLLSLESRDLVIFTLAKLAESRSPETGAHLERIREYCRVLALHLSRLDKFRDQVDGDYVRLIYLTSPLHDIGKVGIPDDVLLKPGPLTPKEFEIMKSHVRIGAETLDAAARLHPDAEFLRMARDIALTHHEKFDGSGYTRGLSGTAIPLCGRIVALADVYDALTTKRVYKDALPHDVAKSIIVQGSGSHFDSDIVDAFLATEEEFIRIRERFDHADDENFLDVARGLVGSDGNAMVEAALL
jgi:putative two-component system response regulator